MQIHLPFDSGTSFLRMCLNHISAHIGHMAVLSIVTLFIIAKALPGHINSDLKNIINLKNPSVGADKTSHVTFLQ